MATVREKLESETMDARWGDLAPQFARGVLVLAVGMTPAEVGEAFARDDKAKVQAWMSDGRVRLCTDDDGRRYAESGSTFRFVIVAPFVIAVEASVEAG